MVQRGLVVSDLHLLSDRSVGEKLLEPFLLNTGEFDLLVLNGDIFDFPWTNRPSIEVAIDDALKLLEKLIEAAPECRIVYLLGNNDCITPFVDRLRHLGERCSRFTFFSDYVRLGDKLFVHGDICNSRMNRQEFLARRTLDAQVKSRSPFARRLYRYIILLGLNRVVYLMHSRKEIINRIFFFFEAEEQLPLVGVSQVFFGHTHAPFRYQDRRGIEFINTGSGIQGLKMASSTFTIKNQ